MDSSSVAAEEARTARDRGASEPREKKPSSKDRNIPWEKSARSLSYTAADDDSSLDDLGSGGPTHGQKDDAAAAAAVTPQRIRDNLLVRTASCVPLMFLGLTSCCMLLCIDDSTSTVSSVSVLLNIYLFLCIASLTTTMGVVDVVLRFSFPLVLARLIHISVLPFAGMIVLYLSTIYAAGLCGYTVAERLVNTGVIRVIEMKDLLGSAAAPQVPPSSRRNKKTPVHVDATKPWLIWPPAICVSLLSVGIGISILWVFWNNHTQLDAVEAVMDLSVKLYVCLFSWNVFLHLWLLKASVLSFDEVTMLFGVVMLGFIALCFISAAFMGGDGVVIAFWITVMGVAGVLGSSLALYHSFKLQLWPLKRKQA